MMDFSSNYDGLVLDSIYDVTYLQGESQYMVTDTVSDLTYIIPVQLFKAMLTPYYDKESINKIVLTLGTLVTVTMVPTQKSAGVKESKSVAASVLVASTMSASVVSEIQDIEADDLIFDKQSAIEELYESAMRSVAA